MARTDQEWLDAHSKEWFAEQLRDKAERFDQFQIAFYETVGPSPELCAAMRHILDMDCSPEAVAARQAVLQRDGRVSDLKSWAALKG